MTLRQLELLIGVADLGSISACAEYYGVSQPAVTNQIRQLEDELATPLLIRSVHGASLTRSGQRAVAQAKRVLREVHRIPAALHEPQASLAGHVNLGVSSLSPITVHHFPQIYRPFHQAFPDVKVDIVEVDSVNWVDQLTQRRVDMVLAPLPLLTSQMQCELLWAEELVVVSSIDSSITDPVSPAALRDEHFILLQSADGLHPSLAKISRRAGFEPKIAVQAGSLPALVGLVAAGIGIAIAPKDCVHFESDAGLVRISQLAPRTYRRLAMVYPSVDSMSREANVFLNYVRSYAQEFSRLHSLPLRLPEYRVSDHPMGLEESAD
jgi:DNA-binding transcriptional LysR family regulator